MAARMLFSALPLSVALAAVLGCGRTEQVSSLRSKMGSSDQLQNGRSLQRPAPVDTPPASVDLKANGQGDIVYVPPGSEVELTWTSEGAAFCTGPLTAIGPKGTIKSPPITEATVFTIVCMGAEGPATDTVQVTPGTPPPAPIALLRVEIVRNDDVSYCDADNTPLMADVAYPKLEGSAPAIILVHGPWWLDGSRKAFSTLLNEVASRGFIAVAIDYRKTASFFAAQAADVRCAVRWLRGHPELKVQKDKIGLLGYSSGAHIAMMAAYELPPPTSPTEESSAVQAVVNWAGPTYMARVLPTLPDATAAAVKTLLNGAPNEAPAFYAAASPITRVTASAPPTWSTYGALDNQVPKDQGLALDAALKNKGARHDLEVLPGQGHEFTAEGMNTAIESAMSFFSKQLKPDGATP